MIAHVDARLARATNGVLAKLAAITSEDLRPVIGNPAVGARLEADRLPPATIGFSGLGARSWRAGAKQRSFERDLLGCRRW